MNRTEYTSRIYPMGNWIYRTAFRFLRNKEESRDLRQDVFLQMWVRRADLDLTRCIEAYVGRTTKFLCIDQLRKARQRQRALEYLANHPPVNPENVILYDRYVVFLKIRAIAESLPPGMRDVFLLRDIEGLEYQEIADRYGMSINWVQLNVSRARRTMIEQIEKLRLYETFGN